MHISRYRDNGRNYIVIKTDDMNENDYQHQMLIRNRIPGLLPCRVRELNGEQYLHFETSGTASAEDYYGSSKLQETDIRRLFTDLKSVLVHLEAYLLSADGLILRPDSVFLHLSARQYRFCFYTQHRDETEAGSFFDWMRERVDPADPAAVELAERAVVMAKASGSTLAQILQELTEDELPVPEAVLEDVPAPRRDPKALSDSDFLTASDWLDIPDEDLSPRQAVYGTREDEEPEPSKRAWIKPAVLMGLFLVTCIVTLVLRSCYELTVREQIISLAVCVVAVMSTIACAAWMVLLRRRKRPDDTGKDHTEHFSELYEDDGGLERTFRAHSMEARMPKRTEFVTELPESDAETETETQTVLLQNVQKACPRLYSRGEERLVRIDLDRLPLTVGKLPGVADFILKREEISRLHARFFRDEGSGRIFMKDLNSTNGTYRNGARLNAGESVALLPGDEVRLGSMEFEFV